MGCDIHLVIERRRKPIEPWVGIYSSDLAPGSRIVIAQRDYDFFAEVANVRGKTTDYKNYPRNVPEDISPLAWQQYMRAPTDHHSASHMTAGDFCAVHHKINPTKSREDFMLYDLLGISSNDDGHEFRVVFWFDN
jgi:hypothetical protein